MQNGVKFIRKMGRVIPIIIDGGTTLAQNARKKDILDNMKTLSETYKKAKSPFIKNNALEKIRKLSEIANDAKF